MATRKKKRRARKNTRVSKRKPARRSHAKAKRVGGATRHRAVKARKTRGAKGSGTIRSPLAKKARKRSAKRIQKTPRQSWTDLPGLDTVSDHSGDTNGKALPGRTIRDQLRALRLMAPRRKGLHLYRDSAESRTRTKRATLYLLIKSDDNTYALHETLFNKRKNPKTPAEWDHYLRNYALKGETPGEGTSVEDLGIIRGAVLPGINTRSQKIWKVSRVLGYQTHDIRKPKPPALARGRNKTKRKGK